MHEEQIAGKQLDGAEDHFRSIVGCGELGTIRPDGDEIHAW
jgi:hypothetical protein